MGKGHIQRGLGPSYHHLFINVTIDEINGPAVAGAIPQTALLQQTSKSKVKKIYTAKIGRNGCVKTYCDRFGHAIYVISYFSKVE